MIKNFEDNLLFSDTEEFNNRSPIQNMLFEIVHMVNKRIFYFYLKEAGEIDISNLDMLITVVANIFSNLSYNVVLPKDNNLRLDTFESMNRSLYEVNKKIFMSLETYHADETNKH